MLIETERLYLREMTENDFEKLNKVLADQGQSNKLDTEKYWQIPNIRFWTVGSMP